MIVGLILLKLFHNVTSKKETDGLDDTYCHA